MSKGKIIVIECISSSVNYINDIKQEGYEPVLLEPYCGFNIRWYFRKFHDKELRKILGKKTKFPEIIMAKRNYSDTLEQIRKLNPVLIIPGSDRGIELATKLSYDLGLKGNNPQNLPKMRDKFIAQQALKNNGVRSIEGKIVSSAKEAVEFFNEMQKNGKSVVVKPVSGIASYGVFVCNTEQEVIKAYNKNATNKLYASYSANKKSVLIQECINGEEYVVNSVSCGGVHKITMILKYRKETAYNGGKIYNSDISVDLQSDLAKALADYQINVLNAIGVEYGAVHSEIMVDENGPVLIEANCRICGGSLKSEIIEECFGISESKWSLLSYLYKNIFDGIDSVFLAKTQKWHLIKEISLYKSAFVSKMLFDDFLKNFPEYRYCHIGKSMRYYPKTTNLSTSMGRCVFACNSLERAEEIKNIMDDIEKNHSEKLYKGIKLF